MERREAKPLKKAHEPKRAGRARENLQYRYGSDRMGLDGI